MTLTMKVTNKMGEGHDPYSPWLQSREGTRMWCRNQMSMKYISLLMKNKKEISTTITTKQDPIVQIKIRIQALPVVWTLILTRASDGWGML